MYTTVNGENIFVRNKRDCIDIIRAGINDDMANYIESLLNDADCSEEQLCKVNDDMESINNLMETFVSELEWDDIDKINKGDVEVLQLIVRKAHSFRCGWIAI